MERGAGDGGGGGDAAAERWTEEVDDLVDQGNVDGAIALLESVVSKLETASSPASSSSGDLRMAGALGDLAGLHDFRGHTLKGDELRARAFSIRARLRDETLPPNLGGSEEMVKAALQENVRSLGDTGVSSASKKDDKDEDEDWEAIADRGVLEETLVPSLERDTKVASCSSSDKNNVPSTGPKRRGRGSFLYDKSLLYSDQCEVEGASDDKELSPQSESEDLEHNKQDDQVSGGVTRFGTRHALVLYDFSTSTRTVDLEKIFEDFRDRGFTIHWVNDSTALAVFRTPSIADEAQACVPSRYKVRVLKEDDDLLTKINSRDLEPPITRPRTSARTAQRLIAHGMGLKPFMNFGSDDLKKQEEARKNRIVARQAMRDDAWGSD